MVRATAAISCSHARPDRNRIAGLFDPSVEAELDVLFHRLRKAIDEAFAFIEQVRHRTLKG